MMNEQVAKTNVEECEGTFDKSLTSVELPKPETPHEINNDGVNSNIAVSEMKCQNNAEQQKTEEIVTKTEQLNSRISRELKLLLELSKEANLDTNIAYKRKCPDSVKHMDTQDSRLLLSNSEARDSLAKRSMRSQNPEFLAKHHKFLSKLSIEADPHEASSDLDDKSVKDGSKQHKKKKFSEPSIGGAIDDRSRKFLKPALAMIQNNKDGFCWRCHRENVNVSCGTCPRSYHLRCLKQSTANAEHWACPECVAVLKAENTKTRSPATKDMELGHFCGLLKFALKRMMQCSDSEHFLHPVNETEFPDYKNYIVQPMDLTKLEKYIKENLYGSTCAFEADAKWMLHNSIIFNSYQSKLTSIAKMIIKVCKQEMAEIENCASCYLNANTKKNWFVEVCPKPHILLWAKLKGFPYWPAKAMCTNSQGMVDARFFGAHDRAWVHFKECFLYSNKDPNANKQKRHDINECVKELEVHIENLKAIYGEFRYAPYRTPYEPDKEQLTILLPKYKLIENSSPLTPSKSDDHTDDSKNDNKVKGECSDHLYTSRTLKSGFKCRSDSDNSLDAISKSDESNKDMEGYGTDDEPDMNSYRRNVVDDSVVALCEAQIETKMVDEQNENAHLKGIINTSAGKGILATKVLGNLKRFSVENLNESPLKVSRKNSDASVKSDQLSNTSSINKVDVKDDEAVSLGKVDGTITISAVDFPLLLSDANEICGRATKKPFVQVKVSNNKFSILPPRNKCKISDRLMKKLTDRKEGGLDKRRVEITCPENGDTNEKNVAANEQVPSVVDINQVILGDTSNLKTVEVLKVNPNVDSDSLDIVSSDDDLVKKDALVQQLLKNSNALETYDTIVEDPLRKDTSDESGLHSNDDLLEELYSEIIEDVHVDESGVKVSTAFDESIQSKKHKGFSNNNVMKRGHFQQKLVKLVDIDVIKKSKKVKRKPDDSTPQKHLDNSGTIRNKIEFVVQKENSSDMVDIVEIKSEPASDIEIDENEDLEAKREYLSALNILEKLPKCFKPREMQAISKTEKKKATADSMSKVINDMASNSEKNKRDKTLVKLLKNVSKQRARKSFPKHFSVKQICPKNEASPKPANVSDNNTIPKISTPMDVQQTGNVVISTQPQSINTILPFLPPNQTIAYTTNLGNPVFTMVPQPIPASFTNFIVPTNLATITTTLPTLHPKVSEKPQNENLTNLVHQVDPPALANLSHIFNRTTTPQQQASTSQQNITVTSTLTPITTTTSNTVHHNNTNTCTLLNGHTVHQNNPTRQTTDTNDDYSFLSGYIPENITKAINDLLCRAPPKLKPRPPGPLSTTFESGIPSAAGPVTTRVNSIAHRLSDYFRGMLIETLEDVGTTDNSEALITSLKLENEKLKHKHSEELLEIKKNVNTILRDLQKSMMEDREKIIEETRIICELETLKRVEEAKSKQWCANCMKEAQFYCCWNTSYCDYPCQSKHWYKHISKCTQNANLQTDGTGSTNQVTPIILRKTLAPKTFPGQKTLLAKPGKVIINKSTPNNTQVSLMKTSNNTLTIVEPTPGSFELVGNGPISVGGKVVNINQIKPGNILTVSSASNTHNTSGIITTSTQKFYITQTKSPASKPPIQMK